MPVHLVHINQPTEQDWIDLGKIYSDAPQAWLSDASNIKASLQGLLDQKTWFVAGRFNNRLLGSMEAIQEDYTITLQHLCVRNVTTNRGVAHQIMHHLNNWADKNGYTLIAKGLPSELTSNLESRGFSEHNGHFIRRPNTN